MKCVDFLIGKSNLNVEICYIIVRNTIISYLNDLFAIKSF